MAKKVQFVETVLRDANQSLIATRLPYDKFEPMLETIDKAGYYAAECWGGATFDVCLRYLHEDPWERLRKIRAKMPNTKLQMLLRGQNVLGYSHYPDDFVKLFVTKAVENGMDVIRIFDALNDVKNMKVAMEATNKAGAIASGTISYTTSPVHTQKKYVEMVKELKEMGAKTICIKDMAGIMGPKEAYDLVSAIKDAVDLPIDLHTHSTTGLAFMTYLKAVEAGVDIIDTAISPFSGGTSQPATETMAYALRQLGYEVDLDDACTKKIADYFKGVRDEYIKDGTLMLHLDQMTHAFGSSNNFAASSLRSHLNGPYLRSLTDGNPDEIITRTVDLTALNGSKEYGTCECKVAPLTLDELRKYHDILPLPESFEWSVTPWSTPEVNEDDKWVMGLHTNGGVGSNYCTYASGSRPAFLIPSSLTVEAEDANPLEQYSTRELAEELFRRITN